MHEILSDFARMIPAALDNVKTSLPTDFPENVVTAVETNVLRLHGRLSRELSEIWGLVVVNEQIMTGQRLDSPLVYVCAHNVYYVKSCLSDAKCFSGSRYSFRLGVLVI